ncbi:Mannosyl-oligosaccharide 1,2-alpha-mannosidase IB [Tyrophagus putrescentiae]|nr:Mannosyl-oligosaccharide 1,2-alpha-mannosidase IB [Tyrophagus putrescentiae]
MRKERCEHLMMFASSSFCATGLLISFAILSNCFSSIVLINAAETEPNGQQPETIASLSEQLKRLTLTVQNHTAQLEELGKVLRAQQQQQQQQTSGTAASTAQISTISSQTTNNNGPQQDLGTKLPPLPECNLNSTPPTITESTLANDAEMATRRQFIAEMTLSAWNAYKQHAWGNATLRPLSHVPPKRNAFGDLGPGSGGDHHRRPVDAAEQAIDGLVWVVDDSKLNFFLLNTNSLLFDKHIAGQWGGLLSAYTLLLLEDNRATLAEAVRQSAEELANILKGAYKESAYPLSHFNLTRGRPFSNFPSSLSQAGGQYLEHAYFSQLTGNESYRRVVDRIRDRLKVEDRRPEDGLYYDLPDAGYRRSDYWQISLGTTGRDFYYNLLRSYLQSGGKLKEALQLYNEAIGDIFERSEMITSTEWWFDALLPVGKTVLEYRKTMTYSACYLGAMFALGAATFKKEDDRCSPLARRQRQLAVELTRTCHQVATGSPTKLGPGEWTPPVDYQNLTEKSYYLSPELAESYFILWRTTKDQQYREAAWEMARALKRYAQTESGGFAGFEDVTKVDKRKDDQPSIFLSATLKYLYLTFTDDSVLPLDKWVFNSAGHPLPICGQHAHLPLEKCKYPIQV